MLSATLGLVNKAWNDCNLLLGDSSDLPDPAILAAEIVEDLQAALDQFAQIASDLSAK